MLPAGPVTSVAATSERARSFEHLQRDVGQGLCLDALFEHRTVRVGDLAGEARWPQLAARAGEVQVGSTLCFQLYVQGDVLGALNLLSAQRHAFDDESEDIGGLLASRAAIAVTSAEELANIRIALDSRDLIGLAKGILMAQYKITAEQAFTLLAHYSQDTNRKLREVAADAAVTGQLQW